MSFIRMFSGIAIVAAIGALSAQNRSQAGQSAAPVAFKTVDVEFPGSDREFPAGPGAELVTNNCTACHSSGMILNQPKLTKATWAAEVNKMVHTYKAPVAEEDIEPIVAYLSSMPVGK